MQFGFKRNPYTIMCYTMYMEIINTYNMKGGNVYSRMLDARKAFDRVNFSILFSLLLQSNLPLATIRLLFNNYSQQQTCTICDQQTTSVFNMSNKVKPRGVTSPIIFKSGIG